MSLMIAAITLSSIGSTQAIAIDSPLPSIDCTRATSNIELKYCAEQAYQAAERELNQTYEHVLTRLNLQEQQRLREIQQSWTGFRDRNCELEVYPSREGTGYGLFLHQCLERMTQARTLDLENYLNFRQEPVNPHPSSSKAKIADLPDGNYRYWTGTPQGVTVTEEELINAGGILFRFRKTGDRIVGIYGQIDNETICISGRVNGNTVAGSAVQTEEPFIPATVLSGDDNFAAWDPSGYLKVRRGRKSGNYARYESALLELSNFSRINAGSNLPPSQCP
jgi:uncharacterized protein YecT (DUF1311 family)